MISQVCCQDDDKRACLPPGHLQIHALKKKKKARTMHQTDPALGGGPAQTRPPAPRRAAPRRRRKQSERSRLPPVGPAPSRGWRLPFARAATYRGSDSASASAASPISAALTAWLAANRRDARACTPIRRPASGRGGTGKRGQASAASTGGGGRGRAELCTEPDLVQAQSSPFFPLLFFRASGGNVLPGAISITCFFP